MNLPAVHASNAQPPAQLCDRKTIPYACGRKEQQPRKPEYQFRLQKAAKHARLAEQRPNGRPNQLGQEGCLKSMLPLVKASLKVEAAASGQLGIKVRQGLLQPQKGTS